MRVTEDGQHSGLPLPTSKTTDRPTPRPALPKLCTFCDSSQLRHAMASTDAAVRGDGVLHVSTAFQPTPRPLAQTPAPRKQIKEVLPSNGLVHSERGPLSEVLCKPKIMPLKSMTLEKIEKLEAVARTAAAAGTGRGIATAVASATKRQATAVGAGR